MCLTSLDSCIILGPRNENKLSVGLIKTKGNSYLYTRPIRFGIIVFCFDTIWGSIIHCFLKIFGVKIIERSNVHVGTLFFLNLLFVIIYFSTTFSWKHFQC
jgi:hypothetical protein